MAKVEIALSLFEEINKKIKRECIEVLHYLKSLESSPQKGKELGNVGGILIKELKYKGFRFYFITDGFTLKYTSEKELIDLLIRFVRMSDKKYQQDAINEIRHILRTIGPEGFV